MIRAYLRASTNDQDASRARGDLQAFADRYGEPVASWYTENASGRSAERVELRRLLDDAHSGDVLLVESVDRLTRLPAAQWASLKRDIEARGLMIVAVDLPSTHAAMKPSEDGDELSRRILAATNSMLLEICAAQAAADYEQRRRRQAQGIAKAKGAGKYQGRRPDETIHARIRAILQAGHSIRKTAEMAGVTPPTVQKVKREMGHSHAEAG